MAGLAALLVSYEAGNISHTGGVAGYAFNSATQGFFCIGSGSNQNTTQQSGSEVDVQAPYLPGTMSNLWCRVITAATGTSTVVLRDNGGNGNETFSIGSGLTGAFSDAIHTDNIAGGDLVDVGITPGSSALLLTILAATFTSSTAGQADTHMQTLCGGNNTGGTGTWFATPMGITAANLSSFENTESQCKLRQRKAMTVKNLSMRITGGGGTTITSRKNGANGTITTSINVGSSTTVQDTAHSDSLAVGDDFDWTFGSSSSSFTFDSINCDFVSSNGDCIFSCTSDVLTTINTSVTAYYGLAGGLDVSQSTEANAQVTANSAFQFSQLTCNVTSNGITNASTINLRANIGNAGPTLSITASTTGIFNDNTDTYSAATTDAMNYQIVTAAAGTSLKLAFISVWGNASIIVPTVTTYKNFRNVRPGLPLIPRLSDIGDQYTTFG